MYNDSKVRTRAVKSTLPITGFSCATDSLMVVGGFMLRINIIGKNPAHRKY